MAMNRLRKEPIPSLSRELAQVMQRLSRKLRLNGEISQSIFSDNEEEVTTE